MNDPEAETGQTGAYGWDFHSHTSLWEGVAGSDSLCLVHPTPSSTAGTTRSKAETRKTRVWGLLGSQEEGDSPVLLPEVGRVVRSRSKSENSSGSVSKPPTAVGAKMFPLSTFPESLVQPPPPSGPQTDSALTPRLPP